MPFLPVRLENEKVEATHIAPFIVTTNQIPLFLIPGILGNSYEFNDLITKMRLKGDTRPVFVYCPDDTDDTLSLAEEGVLIAQSMMEDCMPKGPAPYLIVGYSLGCIKAEIAAKYLEEQGQDARPFLIDGPSPELCQDYFSRSSNALTKDLIHIAQYAAQLSMVAGESKTTYYKKITLSHEEKLALTGTPFDILDQLAKLIIDRQKGLNVSMFNKQIMLAKQSIHHLITHQNRYAKEADLPDSAKLENIVALITDSTSKKYKNSAGKMSKFGGWERYTKTLSYISEPALLNREHITLLKSDKLVDVIENFIQLFARSDILLKRQLDYLFKQHCQTTVDAEDDFDNTANTSFGSASTSSEPSTDSHSVSGRGSPLSDDRRKTVIEEISSSGDDTEESEVHHKLDRTKFADQLEEKRRNIMNPKRENNAMPRRLSFFKPSSPPTAGDVPINKMSISLNDI